jgi:hypothetical protein
MPLFIILFSSIIAARWHSFRVMKYGILQLFMMWMMSVMASI